MRIIVMINAKTTLYITLRSKGPLAFSRSDPSLRSGCKRNNRAYGKILKGARWLEISKYHAMTAILRELFD